MTLKELKALVVWYAKDLRAHGFDVYSVGRVTISKSVRTFGMCRYMGYENVEITISEMAIASGDACLRNTIVHELLHGVRGSKGHGAVWKKNAEKAGKLYGMVIERCASKEEVKCAKEYKIAHSKYVVQCKGCQKVFTYARAGKFVKAVQENKTKRRYRCCTCGSDEFTLE